ncbi:LacI family transcriptional regulator [Clostridium bowmanii]|uniref:LacI family DNA-binding transcriptional regulator n=1 Tax=Clostridium bowmanii TaxID=132925 RepID=UPI001C0D1922|nr:LacI family DNA-binding transcriptional regulator [Clostridium bowmanii]MBU3188034.1 LacI family transcriptional regulator [Clostridium bowmanii]MCA1072213.1 LacI family transcriptional regulator [Clostridium bowmanii]
MEKKIITIKDVAKQAGVSISTVSRAFNNYADISEATRKNILEIADKLEYRPNIIAKSLSGTKNYRLALLVEDYNESDYIVYEMFMAFKSVVSKHGYETVILSTTSDMQKGQKLEKLFKEKQLDGALILGLKMTDDYFRQLESISYPCVLHDVFIKNPKVGCVGVDNIKGSSLAVEHLLERGHTKIGFINGHKEALVSYERLDGYYLALSRRGIKIEDDFIVNGGFSYEGGKTAVMELIKNHKDITAIYCASDLMALGAIEGLKNMGYDIPKDISIVGFDDINLCNFVTPKLTTIRQDREKIGKAAANLILSIISEQYLGRVIIEPELIERESSIQI